MPLYRVALRLAHDTSWTQRRKWSYSFHVSAANAAAGAAVIVGGWAAHLATSHRFSVFAYEAYASSVVEEDTDYAVQSIIPGQQRGTLGAGSGLGDPYLLKACVSIALNVPGSRPARKFARPGLYELDSSDGVNLAPASLAAFTSGWASFVTALEGVLTDPDGQGITGIGRVRLSTREFGRTAGNDVPAPPPMG